MASEKEKTNRPRRRRRNLLFAGALGAAALAGGFLAMPKVPTIQRSSDDTKNKVGDVLNADDADPLEFGHNGKTPLTPAPGKTTAELARQGDYNAAKVLVDIFNQRRYAFELEKNLTFEEEEKKRTAYQSKILHELGITEKELARYRAAIDVAENWKIATSGLDAFVGKDDNDPDSPNNRNTQMKNHFMFTLHALLHEIDVNPDPYSDTEFLRLLGMDAAGLKDIANSIKDYYEDEFRVLRGTPEGDLDDVDTARPTRSARVAWHLPKIQASLDLHTFTHALQAWYSAARV